MMGFLVVSSMKPDFGLVSWPVFLILKPERYAGPVGSLVCGQTLRLEACRAHSEEEVGEAEAIADVARY